MKILLQFYWFMRRWPWITYQKWEFPMYIFSLTFWNIFYSAFDVIIYPATGVGFLWYILLCFKSYNHILLSGIQRIMIVSCYAQIFFINWKVVILSDYLEKVIIFVKNMQLQVRKILLLVLLIAETWKPNEQNVAENSDTTTLVYMKTTKERIGFIK